MNRKVIAVVLCLALALSGGFDTVTQEAYVATTYCSVCKYCGHSKSEHAIDVDILNNSSLVDWCYTCKENNKTSPCKDKPFYEGDAVNVTVGMKRELEAWIEAELEVPAKSEINL